MEQTLVLLKPDSIQRALAGEVISRLERRGPPTGVRRAPPAESARTRAKSWKESWPS